LSPSVPTYPERPRVFIAQFVRRMTKEIVAARLGSDVFVLLATVVGQEDACGYRRAVYFYNSQLMGICGWSEERLARVRTKAAEAGWLHYRPGRRGVMGTYWVLVPPLAEAIDDGPTSEVIDEENPTSPASQDPVSPAVVPHETRGERANTPQGGGGNRGQSRGTTAGPSSLSLSLSQEPAAQAGSDATAKTKRRSKPKADPEAHPLFARFWRDYPKKVGRRDAAKALARINPDEALLGRMLAAIEQQCRTPQWLKDGGQYIPHASTWLNNQRWEDEVNRPQTPQPSRDNWRWKGPTDDAPTPEDLA
jgi:hypothetical protein